MNKGSGTEPGKNIKNHPLLPVPFLKVLQGSENQNVRFFFLPCRNQQENFYFHVLSLKNYYYPGNIVRNHIFVK
ncbi:Uncharacterized protein dnl_58450 [Desulfonema limicola]|uniref:Uncharacterized protein n=1 Tax=Desulfonema limicola TaxID=45656 RepID=A0A975BDQ3_9BACT|nr:Uncharacterized protein dnl_58450 [Desulfonema limicola]